MVSTEDLVDLLLIPSIGVYQFPFAESTKRVEERTQLG